MVRLEHICQLLIFQHHFDLQHDHKTIAVASSYSFEIGLDVMELNLPSRQSVIRMPLMSNALPTTSLIRFYGPSSPHCLRPFDNPHLTFMIVNQ